MLGNCIIDKRGQKGEKGKRSGRNTIFSEKKETGKW
jgi:hypothetical protein